MSGDYEGKQIIFSDEKYFKLEGLDDYKCNRHDSVKEL